jgi:hypothetical protein
MKPFWEITPKEAQACLKATTWSPAIYEYFRGGGFSSTYGTRADMPAFVARHGLPGFSPTQGHIASAIPYLARGLDRLRDGMMQRVMFSLAAVPGR